MTNQIPGQERVVIPDTIRIGGILCDCDNQMDGRYTIVFLTHPENSTNEKGVEVIKKNLPEEERWVVLSNWTINRYSCGYDVSLGLTYRIFGENEIPKPTIITD